MLKLLNIGIILFIMVTIFLLSFSENKMSYRFKKNLLLISTIFISLFCGVSIVGLDHPNYVEFFEEGSIVTVDAFFLKNMFNNHLEPFFVVLISILKQFGLGYRFFFFISALLPMLIIYNLITKKDNSLPLMTFNLFLLFFLFLGPVDTVRHFFAAVIYLSALYSLSRNEKIGFYSKSLVSVLVHYSNISIFFIRPFLKIKWSRLKYLVTFLVLLFCVFLFKDLFLTYIMYANYSNSAFIKFKFYLLTYDPEKEFHNNLHVVLQFLLTYSLLIFNVVINIYALGNGVRKKIYNDKFYGLLLNSQIIGSLLVVLFFTFHADTLGLRLNYLFSIGSFFLVKEIIFNYCKRDKKILFINIIFFLILFNFIIILYLLGIHNPESGFRII